eukprot:CAMPEP_0198117344 /NCGR_PEP_ID=MMETSP1442-20131203/17765_1 /TAXON_ID= /ORGANISM="Craspedostauros australis, Strain CCMP3328" /LENGTH=188 /DNA_ID=CAMNT_0043775377 /DNA_START=63 /DNA_END=629 /DNA_ORIENTATION=+
MTPSLKQTTVWITLLAMLLLLASRSCALSLFGTQTRANKNDVVDHGRRKALAVGFGLMTMPVAPVMAVTATPVAPTNVTTTAKTVAPQQASVIKSTPASTAKPSATTASKPAPTTTASKTTTSATTAKPPPMIEKGDRVKVVAGEYEGQQSVVLDTTEKMIYITVYKNTSNEKQVRIMKTSVVADGKK